MENSLEKSLYDALVYCHIPALPKIEDGQNDWIKAIAKVVKRDGSECYVYVEKDLNLENVVKKDFGSICSIVKVLAYYPIEYFNRAYLPTFSEKGEKNREAKIAHLQGLSKQDFSDLSKEELDKKILAYAMHQQLILEDRV